MKKILNLNSYLSLLAVGLLLLIAGGCKKVNVSDDLSTPRLFKPGGLSVSADQTTAKVSWTATLFTTGFKPTYTAQFSRDTTFATVDFTMTTDSIAVTATDDKLIPRQKYWVRVKTNASNGQAESNWIESSKFSITGIQLFLPVRELEIKETAVTLRFTPTVGLTKITMTPASGTAFDVTLSTADAAAGFKVITGLSPATAYTAELYDTKSKGYVNFTTQPLTTYSVILNNGDDLAAAIAAAANNAVIGLNPGTYNLTAIATAIIQKTITLKSTSYNPKDTKVTFKEFTLKGTGAGINLIGIEFDGAAPGSAAYFINLTGAVADADASTFTSITVDNCIVHNLANCFIRANRAAVNAHKIDFIKVNNTIAYDVTSSSTYDFFTLDKLNFNKLDITKSSFYNLGRSVINCPTVLTQTPAPAITINQCDFNNLGLDATKYVILDANTNSVTFSMTNSIFANTPRVSGVNAAAVRATGAATAITMVNNNFFKFFTTTAQTATVSLPSQAVNNTATDLGWTAAQTAFSATPGTGDFTLPVGSSLRTSSTIGGAIGDPRWAY